MNRSPNRSPLQWGPLTATLRGSRLGPLCVDGHEVWHCIDFLYRDTDWGTPAHRVDNL